MYCSPFSLVKQSSWMLEETRYNGWENGRWMKECRGKMFLREWRGLLSDAVYCVCVYDPCKYVCGMCASICVYVCFCDLCKYGMVTAAAHPDPSVRPSMRPCDRPQKRNLSLTLTLPAPPLPPPPPLTPHFITEWPPHVHRPPMHQPGSQPASQSATWPPRRLLSSTVYVCVCVRFGRDAGWTPLVSDNLCLCLCDVGCLNGVEFILLIQYILCSVTCTQGGPHRKRGSVMMVMRKRKRIFSRNSDQSCLPQSCNITRGNLIKMYTELFEIIVQ